ncbi:PspC domain-containing protein [Bacillus oleivorans]|uniref:PspC domain-containing protein n=1 Tax=Bacillus oleivorans TaxID=1448271 RepID=UPI0015CA071B|nr:PspC domain-containing protein [Bacillus oleivorans]
MRKLMKSSKDKSLFGVCGGRPAHIYHYLSCFFLGVYHSCSIFNRETLTIII